VYTGAVADTDIRLGAQRCNLICFPVRPGERGTSGVCCPGARFHGRGPGQIKFEVVIDLPGEMSKFFDFLVND